MISIFAHGLVRLTVGAGRRMVCRFAAFVLLLAGLLTGGSGCRVFDGRIVAYSHQQPPLVLFSPDASAAIREAAGELAVILNQAYGFELAPESASRQQVATLAHAGDAYAFLFGFLPPGSPETPAGDEVGYATTTHGVYFYGLSGLASSEVAASNSSEAVWQLAVARFLQDEMGFRWLLPGAHGYHFPALPARLSPGRSARVKPTVIASVRPLPTRSEQELAMVPDELRRPESWLRQRAGEYRRWRQRIGLLEVESTVEVESLRANNDNSTGYFFPGHEMRIVQLADRPEPVAIPGDDLVLLDWGLADLARYCQARVMVEPKLDFTSLLSEFTAGMGEAASLVQEYFNYWQAVFADYPQPLSATDVLANLYTELRLRDSGELLRSALAVPGLPVTARFRLESLQLGHEHLSWLQDARQKLQLAAEPVELLAADLAVHRLQEIRRQLMVLTDLDLARLHLDELARADLAGSGFSRAMEELTPYRRIRQWRIKPDPRQLGVDEQWFAADQESLRQWQVYDHSKLPVNLAGNLWFVTWFELPRQIEHQASLLIWGMLPGTQVYFNGKKLTAATLSSGPAGWGGTALMPIPAEWVVREPEQTVVLSLPGHRRPYPFRAVWLMYEQEN